MQHHMQETTDLVLLSAALTRTQAQTLVSAAPWQQLVDDIALSRANWSAPEPVQTTAQPATSHSAGHATDIGIFYVYLKLVQPRPMTARDIAQIEKTWTKLSGDTRAQSSRLTKIFESAGASPQAIPEFHYVVETDPEKGWFDEISAWYQQEHMPGLASVPGCIHTVRLINQDHAPVSFACYDLTAPEVMGSPPWLAVRHTAWSDTCRPHFTNTRRTMFQVLRAPPA